MNFEIVFNREEDGRWTAEIQSPTSSQIQNLPKMIAHGATDFEARSKAQAMALRWVADQIEADQSTLDKINFEVWLG